MSTSELAELETLLVRVLPDPKGYAERVLQELLDRVTGVAPGGDQPWAVASDEPGADQMLVERNVLLAAALGACDCWGTDPACDICAGEGSPGWTEPDHRLYVEYVEPATRRMPAGDGSVATILDISQQAGGGSP
jgi:hypothetical protein